MSDEWRLSVWSREPSRKIAADRWKPSGADPEVREFTLLP
jgi:hypothetical protein